MRYFTYFLFFCCTSAGLALSAETVAEDCAPIVACEASVQIALPVNSCEVALEEDWFLAGAWSTCGATPAINLSSYGPYGPGSYSVLVYAWVGGTYNVCASNFIVEDKTDPVVSCEDQIIYTNDPSVINVSLDAFTAEDNCEIAYDISVYDDGTSGYGTTDMQFTASDAAGNSASCISKYSLRPLSDPYCNVDGNDYYEYIERVRLVGRTTLDNTSGRDDGYGYYVNHSASLAIGESNTITLTPGYSFGGYTEYWRVYIDINDDNVFSGSELVFSTSGFGAQTGSFTTPGTIFTSGSHRMRVVMSYGGYTSPCSSSFYGEVEDYVVNTGYYIFWPGWGWRESTTDDMVNLDAEAAYQAELALEEEYNSTPNQSLSRPVVALADSRPTPVNAAEAVLFPNPVPVGQTPQIQLPDQHGVQLLQVTNSIGQRMGQLDINDQSAQTLSLNSKGLKLQQAGTYLLSAIGKEGELLWTKRLLVQ